MAGERILRCSDGHLFTSTVLSRLLSVHLGAQRYMRCPVDHRWRMAENVDPNELSEGELERARHYTA